MVRIAIDAMGGDNAPKEIVQGVVLAAKEMPTVEFQLYGDEAKVNVCLEESLPNIRVIHCSEKINSDDEPVKAIRSKKDASMVVAAKAVKEGEADALFSCGNTGALLTAGLLVVGRIKGIDRPGLMPVLPVLGKENRQFIMMDVGANAECKPKNVHQFGILGSYYSKYVLGYENPTVGLLNNGAEEGKGNELAKEVYGLLKEDDSLNFVGNVEARDILTGAADVVVTDGFTGNAVLKTMEGTALGLFKQLKTVLSGGGLKAKIGAFLLKNDLRGLKKTLDYSDVGGAVLFGLQAPVVKTHGSSDAKAVYSTIRQIRTMLETDVIRKSVVELSELEEEK